jgi:hypothetical protein
LIELSIRGLDQSRGDFLAFGAVGGSGAFASKGRMWADDRDRSEQKSHSEIFQRSHRSRWIQHRRVSISELGRSLQEKAEHDKDEAEPLQPLAASISVTHGVPIFIIGGRSLICERAVVQGERAKQAKHCGCKVDRFSERHFRLPFAMIFTPGSSPLVNSGPAPGRTKLNSRSG